MIHLRHEGAVAAMVTAAEAVAAAAGDLVLALVADEERASLGTEAVLQALAGRPPDACLIGEPTSLDLAIAHRGYAVVDVSFTSHPAHSAQPALGINAVTHLGRFLTAIEARRAELLTAPAHPIAGAGSLMCTVARGSTSPFVLAGLHRPSSSAEPSPARPPTRIYMTSTAS